MTESPGGHEPLVTVLMSVRDGERHLREAIDSVLAQSFRDFEFIIVDDASADASREIVAAYTDLRIRPIVNEHPLGLTRSLNRGVEIARGRYIARMDADDVSAPDRLELQVKFMEADPSCAVLTTYARKIDEASAPIGEARTPIATDDIRRHLRLRNCITHGSVMMRSDVLRGVGGYDSSMDRAQDYDLWLRISEEHAICTLPDHLYFWRDHGEGISHVHLAEQERFAARAKRAAHIRDIDALLESVTHGRVGTAAAVERICELMREEAEFRASPPKPAGFFEPVNRRIPRLRALRYRLAHRERVREVAGLVRSVRGREDPPDEVSAAIVALIADTP